MFEDIKKCGKYIVVSGVSSLCMAGFIKAATYVLLKSGDIKDITIDDIIGD